MKPQTVIIVAVFMVAGASAYTTCTKTDDCAADECCVPEVRFHIFSKRQFDAVQAPWDNKSGRCVKYIQQKQSCHIMGYASCGCYPGLKCNYYPEPLPTPAEIVPLPLRSKRVPIFKPGKSICE